MMALVHQALLDSSIHLKLSVKQDHILSWFENSMAAMSRVNGTQSHSLVFAGGQALFKVNKEGVSRPISNYLAH